MPSSSSDKPRKKHSASSLSYRSAQNASYRQVDEKHSRKKDRTDRSTDRQNDGAFRDGGSADSPKPEARKRRGCLSRILLPLILLVLILFVLFVLFLRSSFGQI